jgi:hypothetical protein
LPNGDAPRNIVGLMNDLPSRQAPETSRRLGLLFAVAVLALASRWLQPTDGDAPDDAPMDMAEPPRAAPAADPSPLRLADVKPSEAQVTRPTRLGPSDTADQAETTVPAAAARPISAALCHALDERMKALDRRASGKLPRHEMREVRAERARARDLLQGLRCRGGGDRYWF